MSTETFSKQQILSVLGDPATVSRELHDFAESAKVLSARAPRMIEEYPRQWIAIHNGQVRARASTLRALFDEVDREGVPREHTLVRFIEKDIRTLIL